MGILASGSELHLATARDVPSSKVPGTMWPALCKTLSTHIPDEKRRLIKGI